MENQDFTTTIEVAAAPQQVFNAINHVRGWWSENIEGDTDKLQSEFLYHYQDVHRCKIKVIELHPNKRVVWHVLENHFKFTKDTEEWNDTYVIFDILEKAGKTQIQFTHQGLVPAYECFKICQDAWTYYIQDSLKDLIVKGKGNPTPKDVEQRDPETGLEKQDRTEDTSTKSIFHRLLIEKPAERVYHALTTQEGLAGWWTPETIAKPEIGSILRFSFGPSYFKEMKVEELQPYHKVMWLCLHAREEWIGTTLTFELEPHAKGSVLCFHHDGWAGYTPEFASCSYDWALFFRSLKFFCETGKGFPYPHFSNQ